MSTKSVSGIDKFSLISPLSCSRDSPGIWLFILVGKWLNPLGLLEFGQLGWVGEFEESWGIFNQPFGVNRSYLVLYNGISTVHSTVETVTYLS